MALNVASGSWVRHICFFFQILTLGELTFTFFVIVKLANFAYTRYRCQVSVYRTNGPLVLFWSGHRNSKNISENRICVSCLYFQTINFGRATMQETSFQITGISTAMLVVWFSMLIGASFFAVSPAICVSVI